MDVTIALSRRDLLLSQASRRIMRAAGHASSTEGVRAVAERQAKKQHADLMSGLVRP